MDNKYITTAQVGGGGFLVWLSSLDLASWSYIVGIAGVVLGMAAGFYWQRRRDKRDEAIFQATLIALKTRGVTINEEHRMD